MKTIFIYFFFYFLENYSRRARKSTNKKNLSLSSFSKLYMYLIKRLWTSDTQNFIKRANWKQNGGIHKQGSIKYLYTFSKFVNVCFAKLEFWPL